MYILFVCPGHDVRLHPGVSLNRLVPQLAPRVKNTVKLLAGGQWISCRARKIVFQMAFVNYVRRKYSAAEIIRQR